MEMDDLYFHVRKDGIMTKDRNNLMMKGVVNKKKTYFFDKVFDLEKV